MPRGPSLTDWQIIEALRLRDVGLTYQQIADDLGRTQAGWHTRLTRVDRELAESEAA